ncbi:zf-HC2 domain-containing protein [Cellulomonas endophytica]|uniref:zf-HC2 domain-containing protein n=1 Tax=Cellulomonas endophytica TaxID=2494735 RepID=UPI0010124110|nr:zf-HC2 domain-containing protein [Cellulomonas endophytica]
MSDPFAVDAEAYVLGALDEPERTAFEEHLRGCDACRAAVDAVGPLPALLDLVPPDLVARIADADPVTAALPGPPSEHVPGSVLAGLLWSVRRGERRRRRRRALVGGLAAAAVAALLLLVPASPLALVGDEGPAGTVVALAPTTPSPVTASVRLESVAWGTRIELRCRYATGTGATVPGPAGGTGGRYEDPPAYALVVVGADGADEQVATWAAVPGREITVPAATGTVIADIAAVELRSADGRTLLAAELTG